MGKQKNVKLLKEGKISKAEFNKRQAQAKESKLAKGYTKETNRVRKEAKRANPTAYRAEKAQRRAFTTSLGQKSFVTPSSGDSSPGRGMIECYSQTLTNPLCNMCRYPDSYNRPTALFRSVSTYYVPIDFGAGTVGRFSMCLQPIMGSTTTPDQYQLAMTNVATDVWSTADWTSASSYVSNVGGADPRVDINSQYLTQGLEGFYYLSANTTGTAVAVSGTTLFGDGITTNINSENLNLTISGNNQLVFPTGTFLVTISVSAVSTLSAALAVKIDSETSMSTVAIQYTSLESSNYFSIPATPTVGYGSVSFLVNSTPTANLLALAIIASSGYPVGVGVLSTVAITVSVSPVTFSSFATPSFDNGVIEEIRPVGQSILCTYMGTELVDGGTIAMAYVPSDFVNSNFFANTQNALGQAQYVENLMKLNYAYNGRLAQGAYGWWSPFDTTDMGFKRINAMNQADWPAIICSGLFVPSQVAPTGGFQYVVRVQICTVFEFITQSTAFDVEHYLGSQAIIDAVNTALSQQPHCMPNGKHLEWLKKVGAGLLRFAANNKQLIAKLGTLGLSLL